jgi:hypothetical protein
LLLPCCVVQVLVVIDVVTLPLFSSVAGSLAA